MPCRHDDDMFDTPAAKASREMLQRENLDRLKFRSGKLDELTDIMCKLMKKLEENTSPAMFDKLTTRNAKRWWKEHKEVDKKAGRR